MDDIFDEGRLVRPNSRGNANQDTTGFDYDSLESDEFGYDGLPPGPGAAAATDLSTDPYDSGGDDDDEDGSQPGMVQTTYGANPWGIDTAHGYRPAGMMTTDRNMNGMQ